VSAVGAVEDGDEAAAVDHADAVGEREDLVERKAVEVGNIFNLVTLFSEALGLVYKDEEGKTQPVVMGSYGIGPGRVMGTIVEVHADEKGLVWPDSAAPFSVHLVALFDKNGKVKEAADKIYADLVKKGVEVLYDDRDASAGEKFSDSDLIGIPVRWVISEKTLANNSIEVKDRRTGKVEMKVVG
jgi:prolyl-tRNA synthetase